MPIFFVVPFILDQGMHNFVRIIFKELHRVPTDFLLLTEILSTSDAYELFIRRSKSTVIKPAVNSIYKLDGCSSESLDYCCPSLGSGKLS